MLPLNGKPVLLHILERAAKIIGVDRVILATHGTAENIPLTRVAHNAGFDSFADWNVAEEDVLSRYHAAATRYKFDTIARITADCPLLDWEVSSRVVAAQQRGGYDYYSNVHPPSLPDGLDTEVFTYDSLCKAMTHAKGKEREHVTPYIWKRPYRFKMGNLVYAKDLSEHRWTLDTQDDYEFIKQVYEDLGDYAQMGQVLALPYKHTLTRTIKL
jgi:spore coat polysaccharide biosynthesis protein SpsF (cytidylyltransferase family)